MIYKYISTAQNFFDSWRIWFYLFVVLLLLSIFGGIVWPLNEFLFSAVVALAVVILIMLFRISVVTRSGQNLHGRTLFKKIEVRNISAIETWWSYDSESSDPRSTGDNANGRVQQLINYIYIYAKVYGASDTVVLYELIQLSSKFPNNHKYNPDGLWDKNKMIKVYDVDHCITKLKLDHLQIIDPKK